jgi:heme/copper-type cytochrome/quinol oxidase subunit 3
MTSKIFNKILGGVFLADFAYWLYFVATIFMVWAPISDNYTGATWFLFVGKHCVHLLLGLTVIIALFINHKKTILIATPLYVTQIFASNYWPIKPN